MPVGSQGAVKSLSPDELRDIGAQMILSNVYHLLVRPGIDVVESCGGIHSFMGWDRPILTDSGGYQVFSLSSRRIVRADGVEFRNHIDGGRVFLGPVEVMAAQRRLGCDIAMTIDECPPYPCERECACQAVERTVQWAARCSREARLPGQLLFGIVQGGTFEDLREQCARQLTALEFDGYAVGGVSVGEPESLLIRTVSATVGFLPPDRPRYLMGVGKMHQIIEAVTQGVDLFDCVLPTRHARNGTAFVREGAYPLKSAEYKTDPRPIEEGCSCYACRTFSRAYIRHLLNVNEMLGIRLLTWHNLHRYMEVMAEMRQAIEGGQFATWRAAYPSQEGTAT